jgi:hypothetical protein
MVDSTGNVTKPSQWIYEVKTYKDVDAKGTKFTTTVIYDEAKRAKDILLKAKYEIKELLGKQLGVVKRFSDLGYNFSRGTVVRDKSVWVFRRLFKKAASEIQGLKENYNEITAQLSFKRQLRDNLEEALF